MAVSKRLRYEILRRDKHACRYCGATAPDAKLTVDHVLPVALGGTDDPVNLVAACADCNSGKSATPADAPLVAQVEQAALIWQRAIALAAQHRAADAHGRRQLLDAFETVWENRYNVAAPLPGDWQATVVRFRSMGLSIEDLDDAMDTAYTSRVVTAKVFAYFCGVCWNKIRELEALAHQLIDEGKVE